MTTNDSSLAARKLVGSFIAVLIFVCVPTYESARAVAAEPFHIQAHRGAGIAAPENTLEAFTMSWDMGVTPEADLRMTQDGAIVCFHDDNLKRVVSNAVDADESISIEKLDLARVQELEVGSFRGQQFAGQHVPR